MQQYAEEAKNNYFSRKYLKTLFALGIIFALHEKLPYKSMESHECMFGAGYKKKIQWQSHSVWDMDFYILNIFLNMKGYWNKTYNAYDN